MKVLLPIAERGGATLVRRAIELFGQDCEIHLVHVIDAGPRHHMEHLHGPLRHGPRGGPRREREIGAAEESGGRDALNEAQQAAQEMGAVAESHLKRGNPEHEIVDLAEALDASLIILRVRDDSGYHPRHGPASIGHTARFVLDHALCDVLLLRNR